MRWVIRLGLVVCFTSIGLYFRAEPIILTPELKSGVSWMPMVQLAIACGLLPPRGVMRVTVATSFMWVAAGCRDRRGRAGGGGAGTPRPSSTVLPRLAETVPPACLRYQREINLKIALACTALALSLAGPAHAQPADAAVQRAAAAQKQPLLDTLKEFVSIETGSRDAAGLSKATDLLASRLRALGGQVEFVEPTDATTYRMADTPQKIGRMVKASFRGTGSKRILLLAHMDTVYPQGMLAKQPFRIDGDKAYGLGIADDKQGVALVVHIVALLKQLNFNEFGELTVLVNSDEEISSPGSREAIAAAGAAHDVTMSFEASRAASDKLSLATAGIGSVQLKVEGKASHAGTAPEQGVNALYELSHQLLQMRDLSDPQTGLKLNWTISQAGTNRNVIPAQATAEADVRVLRVADYDRIEAVVRERAKKQLLPESKVTVSFERRRPPLEAGDASRKLAAQAQAIYREIGKELVVDPVAEGGGTDAAFAALKTKNAVVERFGLQGFGAHSADAEYILLGSIEPRLYLAARLIMDVSRGRAQ